MAAGDGSEHPRVVSCGKRVFGMAVALKSLGVAGMLAALAAPGAATSGFAADVAAPAYKAPPVEEGWSFQATGYAWASGVTGDMSVRYLPPVHTNVTAWDALQDLDGAVMGSLLAKKGDWMFMADLIWTQISDDATFGRNDARVGFTQTQITASGLVGYRLPLGLPDNVELSATAGFRYQHLTAELDFTPGLFPVTISREGSEGWIDPTVGLSLHYDVNDKWFVNVIADVGGFGVGSKFTTQGFVSVGYMWTPSISTALGYRVIYTDYENDGFVYDITQHGVFTSIAYHF